jgi:hypothetical protein
LLILVIKKISTDKTLKNGVGSASGVRVRGMPYRQRVHPRRVESSWTLLREPQISHLPLTLSTLLGRTNGRSPPVKTVENRGGRNGAWVITKVHASILSRVPTKTCRNALPLVTMSVCPSDCNNYSILEDFLFIRLHIPPFATIGHYTWKPTCLRLGRISSGNDHIFIKEKKQYFKQTL